MEDSKIYFWQDYIQKAPICIELVKNYPEIKKEIVSFISNSEVLHDYPRYLIGRPNPHYMYDNYWKVVPISNLKGEMFGKRVDADQEAYIDNLILNAKSNCPTINSVISQLEEEDIIANCFISRVLPGTVIHPHTGITEDYMRTHLGIVCDPGCKLTVGPGTESCSWEEGKILAFHDGDVHSLRHDGTSERIVLSIDIRLEYLNPYIDDMLQKVK
jgi:hypothetical protein